MLASCTACSDAELAGLAIEAVLEALELREDALEASRAAVAEAKAREAAAAVLLSVDRRRARSQGLSVTPWLGPRTFGVAMVLPR